MSTISFRYTWQLFFLPGSYLIITVYSLRSTIPQYYSLKTLLSFWQHLRRMHVEGAPFEYLYFYGFLVVGMLWCRLDLRTFSLSTSLLSHLAPARTNVSCDCFEAEVSTFAI